MKIELDGKVVLLDKQENTWGLQVNTVNCEEKDVLLVDKVSDTISSSTIIVALESMINTLGIEKSFKENEKISLFIEFD